MSHVNVLKQVNLLLFKEKQESIVISLRVGDESHIDIKNDAPLTAMTLCLWLATKSSLQLEYRVTSDDEKVFGLSLTSKNTLEITFMKNTTM